MPAVLYTGDFRKRMLALKAFSRGSEGRIFFVILRNKRGTRIVGFGRIIKNSNFEIITSTALKYQSANLL